MPTSKLLTLYLEFIKARNAVKIAAVAMEKIRQAIKKAIKIKAAKDVKAITWQKTRGSNMESSTTPPLNNLSNGYNGIKGKGKGK